MHELNGTHFARRGRQHQPLRQAHGSALKQRRRRKNRIVPTTQKFSQSKLLCG
jgi:hypothetical protein